MANLADLVVKIVADKSNFEKGIKSTQTELSKATTTAGKTSTAFKSIFTGVAVAAVITKIGQVAQATINAASEAEETRAKFETAFRGITDNADEVARNLQENYGLATTESEKLLSGTGDLIKGFGASATEALNISAKVQALSVDLASYNNLQGGATQASEILTKAFLGERDSLVSLGIKISEADVQQKLLEKGQQDLTGQTLMLAKGQATLELAMTQSGDAIGDYARTTDSYANVSRRAEAASQDLRVELGRSLLPTATSVKGIFGELTGRLAEYIREINNLREAEKAQELGIATKNQELLVLNDKLESLQKEIKNQKDALNVENSRYKLSQQQQNLVKNNISLKERQIAGIQRAIQELETEQAEEIRLADIERENAEARKRQEQADEEAARIRQENYKATVKGIETVIEANKSDIEVIEDQISALEDLETKDNETNLKRSEAIRLLQAERQAIIDANLQAEKDAQQAIVDDALEAADKSLEIIKERDEEKDRLRKEDAEKEKAVREELLQDSFNIANSLLAITDNLNQREIENLQATAKAKIDALDKELLGEEEYAAQKEQIEKDLAEDEYQIKLKQFNAEKALALIEVAINTARAVAALLANPPLAIVAGIAGVAQAAIIASQPPPPKPAFATGGVATGATNAIVGEAGGEVMLGMGAAGSPLIDELSRRIASNIGSVGNGGGQTINFYGKSLISKTELDEFARRFYPSQVGEQKRRGVL